MAANDRQVDGNHYRVGDYQHWDFAWTHGYNLFEYCATKYLERWRLKNGLRDLKKAEHYLEKYEEKGGGEGPLANRRGAEAMVDYCEARSMDPVQRTIMVLIHVGCIRMARELLELYRQELDKDPHSDSGLVTITEEMRIE